MFSDFLEFLYIIYFIGIYRFKSILFYTNVFHIFQRMHRCNGSEATFTISEVEIPSIFLGSIISPRNVIGDLKNACESVYLNFFNYGNLRVKTVAEIVCL